jgi:T5SS/PEP-CTERM-associated repeat protein
LFAGVSAAALVAMSAGSASANDWVGGTSADWTDGTNWSSGVAPVPADIIAIGTTTPNATVLGLVGPATVSVGSTTIGTGVGTTGNLTIQNGSILTSVSARIGSSFPSTGTVTVTGPGSRWNISAGAFAVGFNGTGVLNIQDGAVVATGGSGTVLGGFPQGSGTLNIDGGGTLQTQSLRGGPGTVQANFDNGILRATAANATFINGFSGTQLNLLAGGLTIDTNGFRRGHRRDVGPSPASVA